MAFIRKIKGSLVKLDSSEYVGEDTYLFYDIDTGCIRRSDGVTPGGVEVGPGCGGSGIAAWGSITGNIEDQLDLEPRLNEQATATIGAGATTTILSFAPTLNAGDKYIISVVDTVTGEVAASEVLGTYKALDNSVSHNHYSKIGDKIKYKPSLVYNAPDVEFTITNNEANPITVSVTRVPTLSV